MKTGYLGGRKVSESFRGAWRADAFLASCCLTAHRTSHRDSPRPRENVECPGFFELL